MKVLLIGSGGREHAIAHALIKSDKLSSLYVAPGNPGTFQFAQNVDILPDDLNGLLNFAKKNDIDLTFVGPEQPLALGIVDLFQSEGIKDSWA